MKLRCDPSNIRGNEHCAPLPGGQRPQRSDLARPNPQKRTGPCGGLEPCGQDRLPPGHGTQPHQGPGDQNRVESSSH